MTATATLDLITVEIVSESTPGVTYTVSAVGCSCPSFTYRQRPCKHMAAPAVIDATLIALGWGHKVAPVVTATPAAQYLTAPSVTEHVHRGGLGCIDC